MLLLNIIFNITFVTLRICLNMYFGHYYLNLNFHGKVIFCEHLDVNVFYLDILNELRNLTVLLGDYSKLKCIKLDLQK